MRSRIYFSSTISCVLNHNPARNVVHWFGQKLYYESQKLNYDNLIKGRCYNNASEPQGNGASNFSKFGSS